MYLQVKIFKVYKYFSIIFQINENKNSLEKSSNPIQNSLEKSFHHLKNSGLEIDFITSFHKEVALVEVKAKDGNAEATKEILGNKRKHQINMQS